MRSNALRKLIEEQLSGIADVKECYYKTANSNAMYPHIVHDFEGIRFQDDDLKIKNYMMNVDVYDKGTSFVLVEDIADKVEDLLQGANLPTDNLLPTFYLEDRREVPDEDKTIKHINIKFQIRFYERT